MLAMNDQQKRKREMSKDAIDVVGITAGMGIVLCMIVLVLSPSPMQQCIKAGYEWRGGDCVMGADHD